MNEILLLKKKKDETFKRSKLSGSIFEEKNQPKDKKL